MEEKTRRIIITTGEPAGIGPDITLQLAQQNLPFPAKIVAIADPTLLAQRASELGLSVKLHTYDPLQPVHQHKAGHLEIIPVPLSQTVKSGELNTANASYVLEILRKGSQVCMEKRFDALVTAPVHKGIINDAGIPFSGHTEFFANETDTKQVVMMLATKELRVALVTTHLPLSEVSRTITPNRLETVIRILATDLTNKFGCTTPNILVCGLNPHAGEGGHLGKEEITTIIPTLKKLRSEGLQLIGPISADTAFIPQSLSGIDAVLTMYHDQGLPVLKQQGFGKAVNITLGLPIIRTSVDHGTALELAGTGKASSESLYNAVEMAQGMIF